MALLTRGEWATEVARGLVPDVLAPAVGLVSHLGDPVFLVALLVLTYWFTDRERAVHLLGIGLGALALVIFLKNLLLVPRPTIGPPVPAESVPWLFRTSYRLASEADGYAIPSGHAMGTTVVYLALAMRRGTSRAYGAAAAIIAGVGFARVYLGAHYLGDVIIGFSLGVTYLLLATRLLDRREPRVALYLAVGIGILSVLATAPAPTSDAMATVGFAIGAAVGWQATDVPSEPWSPSRSLWRPLTVVGGVGLALGLVIVGVGTEPLWVFAAALLAGVTVVAVPGLRTGTPADAATPPYREP
ncbi:phosphatase PAP2 family protein [Haloarchaeobius sp. DYHT-AS-18]|uniref:phosphatase PAP2 family protein n=1 Tax=Haloarchaeobius sp. DYHT-AS-18 TaxID=3446117 RepID=UPI003EBF3445